MIVGSDGLHRLLIVTQMLANMMNINMLRMVISRMIMKVLRKSGLEKTLSMKKMKPGLNTQTFVSTEAAKPKEKRALPRVKVRANPLGQKVKARDQPR